MQLPNFSVDEYALMIEKLRGVGYQFHTISQMTTPTAGKIAYLRHDIDLHLISVDTIARVEAQQDIKATYYVLLTQHYNPLHPDNQRILRTIGDLGHEIGLHYDMETYPDNPAQARARLDWEARLLSEIIGRLVRTISMHQPHTGQPDPFRQVDEYVHPHDPRYQEDLLYVSDSCRAWRDESLLACFSSSPPRRLLLTTHPELWQDGTIADRMIYLDRILMEHASRQSTDYINKVVRRVWANHPAPRLHDERERRRARGAATSADAPGDLA